MENTQHKTVNYINRVFLRIVIDDNNFIYYNAKDIGKCLQFKHLDYTVLTKCSDSLKYKDIHIKKENRVSSIDEDDVFITVYCVLTLCDLSHVPNVKRFRYWITKTLERELSK